MIEHVVTAVYTAIYTLGAVRVCVVLRRIEMEAGNGSVWFFPIISGLVWPAFAPLVGIIMLLSGSGGMFTEAARAKGFREGMKSR